MFKTILAPTDGSQLAEKAVNAAIQFAQEVNGKVISIFVVEPYPFIPVSESAYAGGSALYEEKVREMAEKHLQKIEALASSANVECKTVIARSPSPYEEIVEASKSFNCDVIFMASHGRKGLNKLFMGSETQRVLAHSTVPVLVYR